MDQDKAPSHVEGWSAVCVDGFIPPRAFQAFQAASVLPIAADIRRSLEGVTSLDYVTLTFRRDLPTPAKPIWPMYGSGVTK